MPVNEPRVLAQSPDAKEVARFEPAWIKRLEEATKSRGDVTWTDGEEYRIGKKLGEGSFGVVFEGDKLSEDGPLPVAIKFERLRSDIPQLRDEYRVYRTLSDGGQQPVDGIPRVYYFGRLRLHTVLIMDLLGPSIEDMFREREWNFTVKTVAMLAKRMLRVVEFVHAKGLVHRDLKPENFLLGRGGTPTANEIHLVDFGMAKRYRDPKTQKHIPHNEKKSFLGTARYASINTHLGQEQSRRDDLETLYHVWLYFLRGSLPWQGIKAATNEEKRKRIGEKKQETTTGDLCAGFPEEFSKGLEYVRGLGFEDQPDYNHLQDLLSRVLGKAGEVDDGEFDWVKVGEERPSEPAIRPPPGPVGGNAAPLAPPTAMGMTGKRLRTDSVPEPGQARARRAPVLLYGIADADLAGTANIGGVRDC